MVVSIFPPSNTCRIRSLAYEQSCILPRFCSLSCLTSIFFFLVAVQSQCPAAADLLSTCPTITIWSCLEKSMSGVALLSPREASLKSAM
ncbi:hypothetical protein V2G26_003072 [Clonostachys chloroleuca]